MTNLFQAGNFKFNSDPDLVKAREEINQAYHMDEQICVRDLLEKARLTKEQSKKASELTAKLVESIRSSKSGKGGLDAFLLQYDLSSQEGTALMCMAEALLRIPDNDTRDKLIRDKIGSANWQEHVGKSNVLFVNAATYALMLTGKVVKRSEVSENSLSSTLKKLVERAGEPVIRQAVNQAMKILGKQFVLAQTIGLALDQAKVQEAKGFTYSYDMLGEAARTDKDANFYYKEYCDAILAIAKTAKHSDVNKNPGISVKLSALDARYEIAKPERIKNILIPRLFNLAMMAKKANIGFTIDAEESYRLDISLDIFEELFKSQELQGWHGFGLAVQAYQKRGYRVLKYLQKLSAKHNKKIMVRLVKGAYWDSEIKYNQIMGLSAYPVFTRKPSTDVSYIACAKFMLEHSENFYPQFATHNAYTLATILTITKSNQEFEFQRLHGMGDHLYDQIVANPEYNNRSCRIYAPVGGYKHLLAYLVRRLLENGANSSFVNRLIDPSIPVSEISKSPMDQVEAYDCGAHDKIPLPKNIFSDRQNSSGIDLSDIKELNKLSESFINFNDKLYSAFPVIDGQEVKHDVTEITILNPANNNQVVGNCYHANENLVNKAILSAKTEFLNWSNTSVEVRAACINKLADLLEQNIHELMNILIKESGKTALNAINEVREAVDFCRYYANEALKIMSEAVVLPGSTGEHNQISMHPKGIFVCISPWNFPLAIYLGQVVAALVTGNTVIAKPAEPTPLIAAYAAELLYQAGVPKNAMQFLPGQGSKVGRALTESKEIAGVIFTGSCGTANLINKTLAHRNDAALATFVAETGGLNAMIVDSSSLPEQVIRDVLLSAFDSAGQRCSALRILYVQEEIADSCIEMLVGAMKLLKIGDPLDLATDIGPVIDKGAQNRLLEHIQNMDNHPRVKALYKSEIAKQDNDDGIFVPAALYELEDDQILTEEFFGPILHLVRYKASDLDKVIDSINNTGYALTFAIHSRISETTNYVCSKIKAGNCYVNRNQIGAVVGVQPFGGSNLSGTGPKAGGDNYLKRFCIEKTISVDTTASGGNASLLCLD